MREKLARAIARRTALGLPNAHTNAYRLVHGAGDELEGLTVDVYDRHLVVSLYTERDEPRWIEACAELDYEGIYLKRRPRQANEVALAERQQRAPEHAIVGRDAPASFVVREHDQPFEVRLGDGFSTGLFLDQRDNRARVAALAPGKSVLNLFAYTCAFGAVAAAHGASRTVNIDVAKNVLERGRKNYELAHVSGGQHQFLARDVLDALPRLANKGEQFDLVVLDPPSYASTRRGRFRVEHDYPELVTMALRLLASEGTLLACTNHQKLHERELAQAISLGARALGRTVRELELVSPPGDHPLAPGRAPHLKSAWIRL